MMYAAVVVLKLPDLEEVARGTAIGRVRFPYIPGLFSFRESPLLLKAWSRLSSPPDCLMVDGHGIAHPRQFGIACHLGLWLGIPTIGCAKTIYVGHFRQPGPRTGSTSPILEGEKTLGAALRSKENTKPVFVSTGHLISLEAALRVTLACLKGCRIPETLRQAHLTVNALRQADRTEHGGLSPVEH
jgi:deoxyribonuclease V